MIANKSSLIIIKNQIFECKYYIDMPLNLIIDLFKSIHFQKEMENIYKKNKNNN